ncbi:MAG: PAS domain S-box protein [Spirochaetia bacterium]
MKITNIDKNDVLYFIIGLTVILVFWVVESAIDSIVFLETSFISAVFSPPGHELWMRIMTVITILIFLFIGWIFIRRQKRIARELAESRYNYQSLTEHSPVAVIVHDYDTLLYANPAAVELLEAESQDALKKRRALDFITLDQKENMKSKLNQLLDSEISNGSIEGSIFTERGKRKHVVLAGIPFIYKGKKVVQTVLFDVTKLKSAETKVREEREIFELLFNRVFDVLIMVDDNGKILRVNDAACKMLGYQREELEKLSVLDIHPPEELIKISNSFEEVKKSGHNYMGATSFVSKYGTRIPVEGGAVSFTRHNHTYVIGSFRDISYRQEYESRLVAEQERFKDIVETLGDIIWETDPENKLRYISPQVRNILGYEPEELIGKSPHDLFDPEIAEQVMDICRELSEKRLPVRNLEIKAVAKSGKKVDIEKSGVPVFNETGELLGYRGVDRDISDRKKREEELILTQNVFQNSLEGIVITDKDGKIEKVNPAFTEITGYTAEEAIGQNPRILRSDRHEEGFYKDMWDRILTEGVWEGEIWNRRKSGEAYPEWLSISAVLDRFGGIKHFVSLFHDITDRKAQEKQLKHMAYHDALTGLPNRNLLIDRMKMSIAAAVRESEHVGVLFLDLDNFKNINDSLGHPAGDQLLTIVKDRIQEVCREEDTFARYGGDEFVILLTGIKDTSVISKVSKRIISLFAEPFMISGQEIYSGVSIGISVFPYDGKDPTELLKKADLALYNAKENRKNTFSYYKEALNNSLSRKNEIETLLRRSASLLDFQLYYQPKINLESGKLVSMEALIRWFPAGGDPISPGEFIPIAEETNLILPIGKWVLQTAAEYLYELREKGFTDVSISVNVAARQFQSKELIHVLREMLKTYKIPPQKIVIEITEHVLISNVEKAVKAMEEIRQLGFRISIDDFGTGYSSLGYLKDFPVSEIKIDRTFIKDLPDNRHDSAITRSVIAVARTLGYTVIAEGVETEQQEEFLKKYKCHQAQGYKYSKPVPKDQMLQLLEQSRNIGE